MDNKLTLLLKLEFKVNLSSVEYYQWFSDFSNYPKIFPHIYEIRPINDGDLKPGNEYIEYAINFYGKKEELFVKVLSVKPGQEIWVEVNNPRVRSIFCFMFEGNGNKTLFTIKLFSQHQNLFRLLVLKAGLNILFIPRRRMAKRKLNQLFPPNV